MAAHQAFIKQDLTPTIPIDRYDPSIAQLVKSPTVEQPPHQPQQGKTLSGPPPAPVSSPQRYYGPYEQYSAFTDEEAARLLAHGGTTRKIAGPGSTVLAGPGTTVVMTPGSQLFDARSKAEREKEDERAHVMHGQEIKSMKLERAVAGLKLQSDSIPSGAQPFRGPKPSDEPPSPTASSVAGSKASLGGGSTKASDLKVAGFSDPPPLPPASIKSSSSVRDPSEMGDAVNEEEATLRRTVIPQRDQLVVTQHIYKTEEGQHTAPDSGTFLAHN